MGEADGNSSQSKIEGPFSWFQETFGACTVPGASGTIGDWTFVHIALFKKPINPLRDSHPVSHFPVPGEGKGPLAAGAGICDTVLLQGTDIQSWLSLFLSIAPRVKPKETSTSPSLGQSSCVQESFQLRGEGI